MPGTWQEFHALHLLIKLREVCIIYPIWQVEELRIWKIRQFTHQSQTAERLGLDWTWVCFQRDEQKFLRETHAEGNELVPAPLEVKRARGLESTLFPHCQESSEERACRSFFCGTRKVKSSTESLWLRLGCWWDSQQNFYLILIRNLSLCTLSQACGFLRPWWLRPKWRIRFLPRPTCLVGIVPAFRCKCFLVSKE